MKHTARLGLYEPQGLAIPLVRFSGKARLNPLLAHIADPAVLSVFTKIQSIKAILGPHDAVIGRLEAMCSPTEMQDKQLTSTTNDLERLYVPNNEKVRYINRFLAVKSFQRSEASKSFDPHDLRPVIWCRRTIEACLYLFLTADIEKLPWLYRTQLNESYSLLDIYNFLRDRFRAVWQDLTVQDCPTHRGTIEVLELSTRFFLFAELALSDNPQFNVVQNKNLLLTCFEKLFYCYDSVKSYKEKNEDIIESVRYHIQNTYHIGHDQFDTLKATLMFDSENTDMFYALKVLCSLPGLSTQGIIGLLQKTPRAILTTKANAVAEAFILGSISAYCAAADELPPFLRAVAYLHLNHMRVKYLRAIFQPTFKRYSSKIPIQDFLMVLRFQNTAAAKTFCEAFNIILTETYFDISNGTVSVPVVTSDSLNLKNVKECVVQNFIENHNRLDIVSGLISDKNLPGDNNECLSTPIIPHRSTSSGPNDGFGSPDTPLPSDTSPIPSCTESSMCTPALSAQVSSPTTNVSLERNRAANEIYCSAIIKDLGTAIRTLEANECETQPPRSTTAIVQSLIQHADSSHMARINWGPMLLKAALPSYTFDYWNYRALHNVSQVNLLIASQQTNRVSIILKSALFGFVLSNNDPTTGILANAGHEILFTSSDHRTLDATTTRISSDGFGQMTNIKSEQLIANTGLNSRRSTCIFVCLTIPAVFEVRDSRLSLSANCCQNLRIELSTVSSALRQSEFARVSILYEAIISDEVIRFAAGNDDARKVVYVLGEKLYEFSANALGGRLTGFYCLAQRGSRQPLDCSFALGAVARTLCHGNLRGKAGPTIESAVTTNWPTCQLKNLEKSILNLWKSQVLRIKPVSKWEHIKALGSALEEVLLNPLWGILSTPDPLLPTSPGSQADNRYLMSCIADLMRIVRDLLQDRQIMVDIGAKRPAGKKLKFDFSNVQESIRSNSELPDLSSNARESSDTVQKLISIAFHRLRDKEEINAKKLRFLVSFPLVLLFSPPPHEA